jgi:hypothetical protein
VLLDGESAWGEAMQIAWAAGHVVDPATGIALKVMMMGGFRHFVTRAFPGQRNDLHSAFCDEQLERAIDGSKSQSVHF